jgi:hypothetical protein
LPMTLRAGTMRHMNWQREPSYVMFGITTLAVILAIVALIRWGGDK